MKTAKDYIIFPLDVSDVSDAIQLINELKNYVGIFKIGLQLYLNAGVNIIDYIKNNTDCKVFLDLKLHDIPNTIKMAIKKIDKMNVDFTTVHYGDAPNGIKIAVDTAKNVKILAVTLLTSTGDYITPNLANQTIISSTDVVLFRAKHAHSNGCYGVVCSPQETIAIKKLKLSNLKLITPGIRLINNKVQNDDQKRITTPTQAIINGSDYLVIGRPIREALSPKSEVKLIIDDIEEILKD
jgi:orotidine-5'-phosphate decarboxylase